MCLTNLREISISLEAEARKVHIREIREEVHRHFWNVVGSVAAQVVLPREENIILAWSIQFLKIIQALIGIPKYIKLDS